MTLDVVEIPLILLAFLSPMRASKDFFVAADCLPATLYA
jgi:hypothetical protein